MAALRSRVTPAIVTGASDDGPCIIEDGTPIPGGHAIRHAGPGRPDDTGRRPVEVVVDGWRFELLVEDEDRAALRERAARDRGSVTGSGGPLEIRAIIPGRVASVAVVVGDRVEAGQALLAVEAMKMQNELRASRSGTVVRVGATTGSTVEVGDVLVVLEGDP